MTHIHLLYEFTTHMYMRVVIYDKLRHEHFITQKKILLQDRVERGERFHLRNPASRSTLSYTAYFLQVLQIQITPPLTFSFIFPPNLLTQHLKKKKGQKDKREKEKNEF